MNEFRKNMVVKAFETMDY